MRKELWLAFGAIIICSLVGVKSHSKHIVVDSIQIGEGDRSATIEYNEKDGVIIKYAKMDLVPDPKSGHEVHDYVRRSIRLEEVIHPWK